MKAIILAAAVLTAATPALAQSHYRSGYVTRNGTYVAPSYATNPNSTKLDNYSTQGNYNPYSGRSGTVNPYASTQSNPYASPYNAPRTRPF